MTGQPSGRERGTLTLHNVHYRHLGERLPPRAEYDPDRHDTEEREQAKFSEFEAHCGVSHEIDHVTGDGVPSCGDVSRPGRKSPLVRPAVRSLVNDPALSLR